METDTALARALRDFAKQIPRKAEFGRLDGDVAVESFRTNRMDDGGIAVGHRSWTVVGRNHVPDRALESDRAQRTTGVQCVLEIRSRHVCERRVSLERFPKSRCGGHYGPDAGTSEGTGV